MKPLFFLLFIVITMQTYSQQMPRKRVSKSFTVKDIIGTWQLTKLADIHLNFCKDVVNNERLHFTKDSVFVTTDTKKYAGTWKLVHSQTAIHIKGTNQYNYRWIAGTENSKFFSTTNMKYYKYFIRTKID